MHDRYMLIGHEPGNQSVTHLTVGDAMDWHKIVSNYGHIRIVAVTVRKIGNKRITVEAPLKGGGTRLVVVTRQRLHPRGSAPVNYEQIDTYERDEEVS